jgi:hypothetical protein
MVKREKEKLLPYEFSCTPVNDQFSCEKMMFTGNPFSLKGKKVGRKL